MKSGMRMLFHTLEFFIKSRAGARLATARFALECKGQSTLRDGWPRGAGPGGRRVHPFDHPPPTPTRPPILIIGPFLLHSIFKWLSFTALLRFRTSLNLKYEISNLGLLRGQIYFE